MKNLLKTQTRLTFIQIIFEHISTNNNIEEIFDIYDKNYKSTFVENFYDKKKIKFEFNSNFLKKLIKYYGDFIKLNNYFLLINKHISFNRKFEKWDKINQSIVLAALSEIKNSESSKINIIFNDYLNISKSFVDQENITIINAILDKLINE